VKALIVDFDDSFTFNILSELTELQLEVDVIHFQKFSSINLNSYKLVVLGPGPGHVDDYLSFLDHVSELINYSQNKEFKLLGICLGHQLIHQVLNRDIRKLMNPIHGQTVEIKFATHHILLSELENKTFEVQLYNSWGVFGVGNQNLFDMEIMGESGEILASFSKFLTTYQFHPESIGTSCPELFFKQSLV